MFQRAILITSSLLAVAHAQQIGTNTAETHPAMTWQKCTAPGSCTTVNGKVVLDANWRWVHNNGGTTNCYTGNTWDATLCPDDATCATNCALDGADYTGTYGVTASGSSLKLNFVTQSSNKNVGSRTYLMQDDKNYQMFTLLGNEFTFDVNVANLPCGLNGALYFVSMDQDGGMAKHPTNKAGAAYGTGYCDSQCPRDLKFIAGAANVEGWQSSSNNANTGIGGHGSCCSEMDIWEANSVSNALTPHPCNTVGQSTCSGDSCGGTYSTNRYGGECDPDGCDFNPFRMGNTTFYGPGKTIDTTKPITVVTQFLESGGTLSSIRRFYIQNGVTYAQPNSDISGVTGNEITSAFCTAQKAAFGDSTSFSDKGGLAQMSAALAGPMVLVMSLWDDYAVDMLWLDSTYPTNGTSPGDFRGTCATTSGVPATVESQSPGAFVTYSNIKFGPINSTFSAGPGGGGTTTSVGGGTTTSSVGRTTTTTTGGGTGAPHYGQCGGIGWAGPKTCVSGFTCTVLNPYYSQCL